LLRVAASTAIRSLPENLLTDAELRAMMQRDVIDIPEADDDDITTTAGADADSEETDINPSNDEKPQETSEDLSASVATALQMAHRLELDVLYEDDDMDITDEDVDTAIELAGERVDPAFADLLNAVPVKE